MIDRLKAALADRYHLERELGQGGMATVYLAEDVKHGRMVALKVLKPELALSGDRFLEEIRVTARLQHPGIVPLFDSGDADGFLYYVMPVVEGESLEDRLDREGRVPLSEAVDIARSLASTLAYAHGLGIIHRDIKPSNVLFFHGQPLIADFGIARAMSAARDHRLTATGHSLGTPIYMSPEQATSEDSVDGRSDIYSLGCVLHEMLAGEPPFAGATIQALLVRKLTEAPPALASVPAAVARAVQRTLELKPEDRFATADELAQALGALATTGERGGSGRPDDAGADGGLDAGPSIVVLPFRNLSPEADNAYFADGLTEEIISDLSRLSDLRVISRTSAMRYRDSEAALPAIARELGVRYVLEGSVRKAGEAIRVTTQLIEAATDDHLWSEKFGGTLADVFEIQERISREIVDALEVSLSREDADRLAERREDDPRVLELLMRVRHEIWRFDADALARAEALLDHADELVGESARLVAARAEVLFQSVNLGISTDETRVAEAEALARRAIDMDPDCAQAYSTLGWLVGSRRKRLLEALSLIERACELEPADSQAQVGRIFIASVIGQGSTRELERTTSELAARDPFLPIAHAGIWIWCVLGGHHERALGAVRRALHLDPSPPYRFFAALSLLELGRRQDAADVLEPGAEGTPEGAFDCLATALYHGIRGHPDAARAAITADVIQWAEPDTQYSWHMAQVYAVLNDTESALEWLERAVDNQFWNHRFLAGHERIFDGIREQPRFDALVERAREGWEMAAATRKSDRMAAP